MRIFILALAFLFAGLAAAPAYAAPPAPPMMPGMVPPEAMMEMQKMNPLSVFAYPGQACPAGSETYKGPEGSGGTASGAVYCAFIKKVTLYPKKYFEKCPMGMKTYKDDKAKPASDVMWCEPERKN